MSQESEENQSHTLRAVAERRLDRLQPRGSEIQSDTLRMLHELQVHQLELELQSEVLAETLALCEALRVKYHDMYNFAPVGYLTISPLGKIFEANIAGGAMFGLSPESLVGRDVRTLFCADAMKDIGALFHQLREAKGDVFAYSVLLQTQPLPRYVNIQARPYEDPVLQEDRVSLVLMDVMTFQPVTADACHAISELVRPA